MLNAYASDIVFTGDQQHGLMSHVVACQKT